MSTSVEIRTPMIDGPVPDGPVRPGGCVHGYIRTTTQDQERVRSALADIEFWCAVAGHSLASVFVDSGVPDDAVERPAYDALVTAAGAALCEAVVVAHPHHLSWNAARAERMAQQVWSSGTRIVVAPDGTDLTPDHFTDVRYLRGRDGTIEAWEKALPPGRTG